VRSQTASVGDEVHWQVVAIQLARLG
jgi:hypothetical protein